MLAKLNRSQHRRATGLFLIEEQRILERAMEADFQIVEIYAVEEALKWPAVLQAADRGAELIQVTPNVLNKLTYRDHPEGMVAVVRSRTAVLAEWQASGPLIVCSGLEKPGNLGAILRSVDAAGASGMLIDEAETDLYNPQTIRASTGAIFTVPTFTASRSELLDWLHRHQYRIIAASPEASVSYTEAKLAGQVAIVVGAEAEGLSDFWKEASETLIAIPLRGNIVDSLNVSVTAALLLFESMRE